MIHSIHLNGCSPTPLAGYLKALGILRLVAEQADADARGYWQNDTFVLETALDRDALQAFFLDQYRPTPILAPWNGGSGFYFQERKLKEKDPITGKRVKTGIRDQATEATKAIDTILGSSCERFKGHRSAALLCKAVVQQHGFTEAPKGGEKDKFVSNLRNSASDNFVTWLDAALLVTTDGTNYPPLLGTGGNDGNLDFTNNFLQRLVSLIDPDSGTATPLARQLLPESLFGIASPGQLSAAIGQFSPGAAGSPNGSSGFESRASINPWDFVLMLEGAILFATSATRRLGTEHSAVLSYPFTVRSTGSGSGNTALADEEPARPEIWMPLWNRAVSLDELRSLLSEGHVSLHGRPVRDGLDFVRAISQLGIQRGISAFQRYGFLRRSGKAYLATPLARVPVVRNPAADLIDQLDRNSWLSCFRLLARRKEAPARLRGIARQLEDALFDLSRYRDARYVQQTLIALGQAQGYLALSAGAREHCLPVPRLKADWVLAAHDDSTAFRIAAALAGLHGRSTNDDSHANLPMAMHFAPIDPARPGRWAEACSHAVLWNEGALTSNLYEVLRRRLLDAECIPLDDKPLAHFATAPLSGVAQWLTAPQLDTRIDALLRGLVLARIPHLPSRQQSEAMPLPAAYALLKPLFCTDAQLRGAHLLDAEQTLALPSTLVTRLRQGRTDGEHGVLHEAQRRLRAAGMPLSAKGLSAAGIPPQRLLMALLVPLDRRDLLHLTEPLRAVARDSASAVAA